MDSVFTFVKHSSKLLLQELEICLRQYSQDTEKGMHIDSIETAFHASGLAAIIEGWSMITIQPTDGG